MNRCCISYWAWLARTPICVKGRRFCTFCGRELTKEETQIVEEAYNSSKFSGKSTERLYTYLALQYKPNILETLRGRYLEGHPEYIAIGEITRQIDKLILEAK